MPGGVEELDSLLQSLQALKAPGASKSKITAITSICVDNPQSDSSIAQKLYSHFKKTFPSHKLGILFVVDSVIRQWIDRAKQSGQNLSGAGAPGGTYASGVQRLTELMPSLIDDVARVAPDDQKAKIQNLVDIWDRGSTFPAPLIATFKQKLAAPQITSTTPPGSPPANTLLPMGIRGQTQSLNAALSQPGLQPDTASLLQALAGMSHPSTLSAPPQAAAAPPQPPTPTQPDLAALLAGLAGAAPPAHVQSMPQAAQVPQVPQFPQMPQQMQPPAQYAFPPQFAQPIPPQVSYPNPVPPQLSAFLPIAAPAPAAPTPAANDNALATLVNMLPPNILSNPQQLTQALELFSELAKNNIPQEQWGPVLAALYPSAAVPAAAAAPPAPSGWQAEIGKNGNDHGSSASRMRNRDRSRSPDRRGNNGHDVNRRPSPVYGTYTASAKDANEYNDSDGRSRKAGGRYRQRSPPGSGRNENNVDASRSQANSTVPGSSAGSRPKWISHDPSLPPDHIKVLSRTLFVGGCTVTERELRSIFSQFGEVQTCIVNLDKRHAFVKMCTRTDSLAAKSGMERMVVTDPTILQKARQTKWGVGFGPRDCCDYTTGESIVPLHSLTEADQKWALTAEYGGTGGRSLQGGMVIEEPDIEIGAGVSSKAMSKRVSAPDGSRGRGGRMGGGGGGGGGGRDRFRKPDGGSTNQGQGQQKPVAPRPQEQPAFQPPPPVPNFGFQFTSKS